MLYGAEEDGDPYVDHVVIVEQAGTYALSFFGGGQPGSTAYLYVDGLLAGAHDFDSSTNAVADGVEREARAYVGVVTLSEGGHVVSVRNPMRAAFHYCSLRLERVDDVDGTASGDHTMLSAKPTTSRRARARAVARRAVAANDLAATTEDGVQWSDYQEYCRGHNQRLCLRSEVCEALHQPDEPADARAHRDAIFGLGDAAATDKQDLVFVPVLDRAGRWMKVARSDADRAACREADIVSLFTGTPIAHVGMCCRYGYDECAARDGEPAPCPDGTVCFDARNARVCVPAHAAANSTVNIFDVPDDWLEFPDPVVGPILPKPKPPTGGMVVCQDNWCPEQWGFGAEDGSFIYRLRPPPLSDAAEERWGRFERDCRGLGTDVREWAIMSPWQDGDAASYDDWGAVRARLEQRGEVGSPLGSEDAAPSRCPCSSCASLTP